MRKSQHLTSDYNVILLIYTLITILSMHITTINLRIIHNVYIYHMVRDTTIRSDYDIQQNILTK